MYSSLTTKHKSFLKRYSHNARFRIAVELLNPNPEDKILDYGTGNGHMIEKVIEKSNCHIVGYEPASYMFEELKKNKLISRNRKVELCTDIKDYPPKYFHKICCLEVFEHLPKSNQYKEIKRMLNLLNDGGKLLISVPIECGFSSLCKNIARILIQSAHANTTFKNIVYSLFRIPIDRGEHAYIHSHIGFYYPDLEKVLFSCGLKKCYKTFSPIPFFRGGLNSQVFFILEKDTSNQSTVKYNNPCNIIP
jgi:protein-L-isoaspartate O-methyltransferase